MKPIYRSLYSLMLDRAFQLSASIPQKVTDPVSKMKTFRKLNWPNSHMNLDTDEEIFFSNLADLGYPTLSHAIFDVAL